MFWAGPKVINPPASTLASHFWPFSPGIIIYIKNRNKKGVPFPWNSHQNLPDSFARPPATKKTGTNGPWNFVKLFARSTNASAPVPVINTATKNNCLTAIPLRLFLAQYLFSIFMQQKSPTPQPPISAKPDLSMRLQGLEPWTNRLRVYCSTNWAKGAFSWTQREL